MYFSEPSSSSLSPQEKQAKIERLQLILDQSKHQMERKIASWNQFIQGQEGSLKIMRDLGYTSEEIVGPILKNIVKALTTISELELQIGNRKSSK
jgi:hypothetical protein